MQFWDLYWVALTVDLAVGWRALPRAQFMCVFVYAGPKCVLEPEPEFPCQLWAPTRCSWAASRDDDAF
jgi:hypothetical protein